MRQQTKQSEHNNRHKLSFVLAEAIRASNKPRKELAKDYGVSTATITNILNYRAYRPEGMENPPPKPPGRPRTHKPRVQCECGCKELCKPGRRFLAGHYARTREYAITRARTGDEWLTDMLDKCQPEDRGFETECMIWTGWLSPSIGYPVATYQDRRMTRHRLMFLLMNPEVDLIGKDVHHLCEQRDCLNPHHLVALTRGEHRQSHSVLSRDDVTEIRALAARGYLHAEIARRFGITRGAVSHIVSYKRWADAA